MNPDEECYHGTISGATAIKRLKATDFDCHLIRYSKNQKKYILAVLKKGLGEDEDNDLIEHFEIKVEGNRCQIDGHSQTFKSLKDLLSHYKDTPLHPSIHDIGECCPSPRYRERMERRESEKVQRAAQALLREQGEEHRREMRAMKAKIQHLENMNNCIIL